MSLITLFSGGKSLYDVFRAIVREEVLPSFFGSRVCDKCTADIDEIEDLYREVQWD